MEVRLDDGLDCVRATSRLALELFSGQNMTPSIVCDNLQSAHSLHVGAPEPHPCKFEAVGSRRRSEFLPKIELCRLDRIRRRLLRCLILGGFVAFAPSLALGV